MELLKPLLIAFCIHEGNVVVVVLQQSQYFICPDCIVYYDITVGDSQTFRNNLRKVLGNEWIVNLRSPFTIQSGNNLRRKAILTVICMLTVIVLGAIIVNFDSTIAVVHAGSVKRSWSWDLQ